MITKLTGKAESLEPNLHVIDVAGVGYEVQTPLSVASHISSLSGNSDCTLWIYTHVRDDSIQLFGFVDEADKRWFKELLKIHGIGTKMALAIMSTYELGEFNELVINSKEKQLENIPGVGAKKAKKLILEISDKLPALINNTTDPKSSSQEITALEALENLGFKSKDVKAKISKVYKPGMDVTTIVKKVLKTS